MSLKKELQLLLNETPSSFSLVIDDIVKEKKCSLTEAIVIYCEKHNVDVTEIAVLVSPYLKARIQIEAEKLNLVKKTVDTLF